MRILLTGLNHRTAPLVTREALSLTQAQVPAALAALQEDVGRGVIVSTCNRMEVYVAVDDPDRGQDGLRRFFERQFGVRLEEVSPYLYTRQHDDAVRHLYRVASSLDSLIIGESEILGQVREAYSAASRAGVATGVLAHVFHNALRVGKRARAETAIGRNALSVSRACVEMARRALGDLRDLRGLVVGVGEAGSLAARALRDAGVADMTVTSRTLAHARELAAELDGTAAPLAELQSLLTSADIVVSGTGAPDLIVTHDLVAKVMSKRGGRPLFVIDIALPRDIDPSVAGIPGVHLYTMYDLELIAEANRKEREAEAKRAERIVEEEVAKFESWWETLETAPTITAIRSQAEAVREAEVARMLRRANGMTAADRAAVEAMSKALVKKLLHRPTARLRERGEQSLTHAARELFGIDGD